MVNTTAVETSADLLRRLADQNQDIIARLDRLEKFQGMSVVKEAYTTEEAAERLGRSDWTVRQWCNRGQAPGAIKVRGKGRTGEWRLPHDTLLRLQSTGPGPVQPALAA